MSEAAQRILVLGAASAIAECGRLWATQGARFALVARNADRLDAIAANLRTLGAAETHVVALDCAHVEAKPSISRKSSRALGGLDMALLAYGTLGEQKALEADPKAVAVDRREFFERRGLCLETTALLERQRSGGWS